MRSSAADHVADRILLVVAAFAVLFIGLFCLLPFFWQVDRRVGMVSGMISLRSSSREGANSSWLTNREGANMVWPFSNAVSIGGTHYQCMLATRPARIGGHGILAITTDHLFIWLGTNVPPKLIPPGYKPPLFGY
jgi:hypothetical protein